MPGNHEAEAAKISFVRAAAIGMLAIVAGAITAFLIRAQDNAKAPIRQDLLVLKSVRYWPSYASRGGHIQTAALLSMPLKFRIAITVDGVTFTYPGRKIWQELKPDIPAQNFQLEAKDKNHQIFFKVFYTATGSTENVIEKTIGRKPVTIDAFPFSGTYKAFEPGAAKGRKARTAGYFEIDYEVRRWRE